MDESKLLKKTTVAGARVRKGEAFTDVERAIVKTVVLEKIDEWDGVPYHLVDNKDVPDGNKFVPFIKAAMLAANAEPVKYTGKGRPWASYAFLATSCLRQLIQEAKKDAAAQAKTA